MLNKAYVPGINPFSVMVHSSFYTFLDSVY